MSVASISRPIVLEPLSMQEIDRIFTQDQKNQSRHEFFVDKYQVKIKKVTEDSEGTYGEVARTRYPFLVVKCFKNALCKEAWRESRTLRYLYEKKIPHVPNLYDVSSHIEEPMLLIDNGGFDLEYLTKNKKLHFKDISKIARQVLEVVAYLKKLGLSHNDLKPRNVCFMPTCEGEGETKVVDWGGATSSGEPEGIFMYTKAYDPPEGCLDLPRDSDEGRSKRDVWAVGATLFYISAFNGHLVSRDAKSKAAILHAIVQRVAPLPKEMIEASSIKEELFDEKSQLRIVKNVRYSSIDRAFRLGKIKAGYFFEPHTEGDYKKIADLVRDLLNINPEKRPLADEALKKYFPSEEPLVANAELK